jgi:hypothetical protein
MSTRRFGRSLTALSCCALLALSASGAFAQVDPVQIFPLPGAQNWTAIPGAANMDLDPADEIVLVNEDSRLVIVDAATGEIQFDSQPYGWTRLLAPGWEREGLSTYHRSQGFRVFCDEDGDGIFCVNILIAEASEYENQLAVICLDRNVAAVQDGPGQSQLQLGPNIPNPARATTRIDFTLASSGAATVRVLDTQGRLVRTLLNRELPAGKHSVVWDGRSDEGRSLATGMYYYELEANGERSARKAVLLR